MARRKRSQQSFLIRHSLTLVVSFIWLLWVFFGNSIADWLGTLAIVIFTKYLHEEGSAESNPPRPKHRSVIVHFLDVHSLTLAIMATGAIWIYAFARSDPGGKVGEVLGNIVSEWGQLLAWWS